MRLLYEQATPGQRLLVTRYVFGIWLLKYVCVPLESLAALPHQYYTPVGILYWAPFARPAGNAHQSAGEGVSLLRC